jgi:hypothetical protein
MISHKTLALNGNASGSLQNLGAKLAAWREVMERHGLA